jgi:D-glycero-alpha-D-manno-heptose-7-phosphate kinase
MVISKTPLRMSFAGGGTDLPAFFEKHGGAVLSTAIDKWVRVGVAARFEGDVRVSYSQTEIVDTANDVEHELVREAMKRTGIARGVEVITLADLPSRGTGLGSSSTVTVGLLTALYAYQGVQKSPEDLAMEACRIEIDALGKPIGKQDQYAAAIGGMNLLEFKPDGSVVSEPVVAPPEHFAALHRSLLLFYTGAPRQSGDDILAEQGKAIAGGDDGALLEIRDLAYGMRDRMALGDIRGVGELLHQGWELKRRAAPGTTNHAIDGFYESAREAGAWGGKLLGAGGGGFFLLSAAPESHGDVRRALSDFREIPFRFANRGTHLLLVEHE